MTRTNHARNINQSRNPVWLVMKLQVKKCPSILNRFRIRKPVTTSSTSVPRLPFEAVPVDLTDTTAGEEHDHLAALPAVPPGAAPRRDLLYVEPHRLEGPVGQIGVEIPAQPALGRVFPGLGVALHHQQRF